MASSEQSSQIFTNTLYNKLKFVAQILLPAIASLYFGLSEVWELPYGVQIVGTITLLDTFLGIILGLSTKQYYKNGANFDGDVNLVETEDGAKAQFAFDKNPVEVLEDEPGKHSMEFKVNRVNQLS